MGIGICIILSKNGKILLGKRNDDPEKAGSLFHGEGTWTLPGGKIEFGESFEKAAKRELAEETGIMGKEMNVIGVTNDLVPDAHFATIACECTKFEGNAQALEDEITEWSWFPLDDLPKPIFKPSEKAIKNYKEQKFYKY